MPANAGPQAVIKSSYSHDNKLLRNRMGKVAQKLLSTGGDPYGLGIATMPKISPAHGIAAASLALAVGAAWGYPTIPSSSTLPFGVHKGCGDKAAGDYDKCHAFIMQETTTPAGHQLAAQAIFQISGNDLYITLSNTSSEKGTYLPEDFLTGLFFNLKETNGTAVLLSSAMPLAQALAKPAVVGAGANAVPGFNSDVVKPTAGSVTDLITTTTGGNVGGEWQYKTSDANWTNNYSGFAAGISSTKLGNLFSNGNFGNPPSNIDPSASCLVTDLDLNGCGTFPSTHAVQMGLVGPNYSGVTPKTATGMGNNDDNPLAVRDSVRFKFDLTQISSLSEDERGKLNLSKSGALDVGFQYGSTFGSGLYKVPEPGVLGLLALGGLALASRRRSLWLRGRSRSPDIVTRSNSPGTA